METGRRILFAWRLLAKTLSNHHCRSFSAISILRFSIRLPRPGFEMRAHVSWAVLQSLSVLMQDSTAIQTRDLQGADHGLLLINIHINLSKSQFFLWISIINSNGNSKWGKQPSEGSHSERKYFSSFKYAYTYTPRYIYFYNVTIFTLFKYLS